MVQVSLPYMTTGKTTALTKCTFVSKAKSLFLTLSTFVIASLPRSKRLLILWVQSPSTVIWEPKKRKFVTVSTFSPSICHDMMGLDAMILENLALSSLFCFTVLLLVKLNTFHCWSNGIGEKTRLQGCQGVVLNMPANLENSAVAPGLAKVSFHSNPKER